MSLEAAQKTVTGNVGNVEVQIDLIDNGADARVSSEQYAVLEKEFGSREGADERQSQVLEAVKPLLDEKEPRVVELQREMYDCGDDDKAQKSSILLQIEDIFRVVLSQADENIRQSGPHAPPKTVVTTEAMLELAIARAIPGGDSVQLADKIFSDLRKQRIISRG